ncbi:MAG: cation transporter [Prolixibacteraceae bacterium]|nr:cation transporter [Prolixibacteraceae bacterium]
MKQVLFIVLVLLAFSSCNSPQKTAEKAQAPVMVEAKLKVEGMTCTECEASIAKGVNELAGIDSISANHLDSTAFVRFDSNKTNLKDISKAIEGRGYVVASK